MNVLVLGQGGREHAIVRSLRFSSTVSQIHVIPGSDGMALEAVCHPEISATDSAGVLQAVRRHQINLVVIGPEVVLAAGVADSLRAHDIAVFGPSQEAARLESSKIFAKDFMLKAGVPTADSFVVDSVESTLKASEKFVAPFVLKADGLAAGKGVFICQTLEELRIAAHDLFEESKLGEAGSRALLERFEPGYELSYLILTNGSAFQALPLAQDHKRLQDNDQGPNTGGMGVVAPLQISDTLEAQIRKRILEPVMSQMTKERMLFRGVLYVGVMVTTDGPKVLEFNTRFGDPEAQALLPLVTGDWGQMFLKVAQGQIPSFKVQPLYTMCVVLAAEGYPDHPVKGAVIEGDVMFASPSSYFLHAGTKKEGESWVTNGGRVLNAIGLGSSKEEARKAAYLQAAKVHWQGMQRREDIGLKTSSEH